MFWLGLGDCFVSQNMCIFNINFNCRFFTEVQVMAIFPTFLKFFLEFYPILTVLYSGWTCSSFVLHLSPSLFQSFRVSFLGPQLHISPETPRSKAFLFSGMIKVSFASFYFLSLVRYYSKNQWLT